MTPELVLKTLQSFKLTEGLTMEQLETLSAISSEIVFSEGQTIFREADVGEFVYLIVEGQVALEIYIPSQGRITILTVGPGQLLGWSSLFPSTNKTASGRAMTSTQAVAINAAQLREALEQDHDMGYLLLWRISEVISDRLKATRLQLLDIFAPSQQANA